jgi:ABC-type transport system involved in multi-copper enzyme maturation permease subunit
MIFFYITKQTFIDIYKGRVLYSSLFSAALLLLVTFVAVEFSYSVTSKVALDVGMGLATLATNLLCIFLGVSLLSDEVENRTLYMILSRPVSRGIFISAKVLGLCLIVGLNLSFLSFLTLLLHLHYGGEWTNLMMWNYLFIYFETILIMLVAVLTSLISQKTIAVLVCFSFWLIGHACVPLKELTLVKTNKFINFIIESYISYGPNLYKINIKNFIVYNNIIDDSFLLNAFLYALCWCSLLLILNILIFQRKELT